MASTPARTRARKDKPEGDVEFLGYSDDGHTFEARLFGERTFTFSTDVNTYILGRLTSELGVASKLLHSLLEVIPQTDDDGKEIETVEAARFRLKREFDDLLDSQKGMSFERVYGLVDDLARHAMGNETGE